MTEPIVSKLFEQDFTTCDECCGEGRWPPTHWDRDDGPGNDPCPYCFGTGRALTEHGRDVLKPLFEGLRENFTLTPKETTT